MQIKRAISALSSSLLIVLAIPISAGAAGTTVVVTPTNTQGFSKYESTPGGAVNFVADPSAPGGSGALQLTTSATITAKAQYIHATNTPLASVTQLSYYTKQNSAPFPGADPSYQLITLLNGTGAKGFTTLVYEPYQNPQQGPVVPGVFQKHDVAAGLFYSTRTVTCSKGTLAGSTTGGGPANYTLAQIKTICPNAVVVGFGVNIGSNNPLYNVETDLLNFNGTIYNFEVKPTPTSKNQCKKDGYKNYIDTQGKAFKNQGKCVSFVTNIGHDQKENNQEDNQKLENIKTKSND